MVLAARFRDALPVVLQLLRLIPTSDAEVNSLLGAAAHSLCALDFRGRHRPQVLVLVVALAAIIKHIFNGLGGISLPRPGPRGNIFIRLELPPSLGALPPSVLGHIIIVVTDLVRNLLFESLLRAAWLCHELVLRRMQVIVPCFSRVLRSVRVILRLLRAIRQLEWLRLLLLLISGHVVRLDSSRRRIHGRIEVTGGVRPPVVHRLARFKQGLKWRFALATTVRALELGSHVRRRLIPAKDRSLLFQVWRALGHVEVADVVVIRVDIVPVRTFVIVHHEHVARREHACVVELLADEASVHLGVYIQDCVVVVCFPIGSSVRLEFERSLQS